jgi:hypothetical protein
MEKGFAVRGMQVEVPIAFAWGWPAGVRMVDHRGIIGTAPSLAVDARKYPRADG